MANTSIEWATEVWNPVVGCSKVSAGCKNCYAERMARRLKGMGHPEYQAVVDHDRKQERVLTGNELIRLSHERTKEVMKELGV